MEESPISQAHPAALLELGIAVVIALGAGYLAVAMSSLVMEGGLPEAQDFLRLSPIFFPRLSFGLTSLISFILIFRILRSSGGRAAFRFDLDTTRYTSVLIMGVLLVVYALLLPLFGYGIATLLAVAATTFFLGTRSWWSLLVFSLVTPVVTRFIFERLLAISLPLSPFEPLAQLEQTLMRFLASIFIWS